MQLTKAQLKHVRSLEQKRHRETFRQFVAEGPKTVGDLMRSMRPCVVFATDDWPMPPHRDFDFVPVTQGELSRLSLLKTPQQVVAVFPMPDATDEGLDPQARLTLALDGVQDPGNLGTIIRLADWFGIRDIVCSEDTADTYNPKVVQATMGSLGRVNVVRTDLKSLLRRYHGETPVYGTTLDGDNIYGARLEARGFVVMGNEGRGISPAVKELLMHRLLIPPFGHGTGAESLNVAIATAIVCSEFRRREA